MEDGFIPIPGAEGWQLSNAPVLAMAVHYVALDLHCRAGMPRLRKKSLELSAYLHFVLQEVSKSTEKVSFESITPLNDDERGSQVSLLIHGGGKEIFDELTKEGVIADWREPNVIRLAPVAMYNSFEDIYEFGEILKRILA